MPRDLPHGFFQQLFAGCDFVPGRSAGGMRQWDEIKTVAGPANTKLASNHFIQVRAFGELHNRQTADWNNQARL